MSVAVEFDQLPHFGGVNAVSFASAYSAADAMVAHPDFDVAFEWAKATDHLGRDPRWAADMICDLAHREITQMSDRFALKVLAALRCGQAILAAHDRYQAGLAALQTAHSKPCPAHNKASKAQLVTWTDR